MTLDIEIVYVLKTIKVTFFPINTKKKLFCFRFPLNPLTKKPDPKKAEKF